ncbi:GrpB family protein [Lactobacillus sp. ESL0791]|uniref:GrpB family protein n=1 Tax=Lactobacillus sp. ESL0791 TaxID=2983234 RepID=UPI0023F78792|nr:GrpB family protein [Lactobacillus sp. ESL0791]MDF7638680.1 GrpB family protein [Lactobacillus sp. ESL0791]
MNRGDYLQRVTLGKVQTNPKIELAEYEPHWPQDFQEEKTKIKHVLGETALKIEHIGSTSVPGLCAKPIIDILLLVPDSGNEESYVPQLEKAGYILRIREPEWQEHRMFVGTKRKLHLHVFSPNSQEARDMLHFRDWLRINKADREKYQQAKEDLAKRSWKTVQEYADAKGPVVNEIKKRANHYFLNN